MDDPKAVIHDISSDEEGGGGGGGGGDDFKWISELLLDGNDDYYSDDTEESDEVVVVGEVFSNGKKRKKSSNGVAKAFPNKDVTGGGGGDDDDDDDEDCVVLDGDPEKPLLIENAKVDDDDSDELVVTGEKGEVACRDFPHSRHLCAKYPFASTPHEKHCDQCHCYVCDSLAPCVQWGTGISSINHCHATDKDEFWKAQRKTTLRSDKTPLAVPALVLPVVTNTVSMSPHLTNQPQPFTSNTVLQNQILRPTFMRPCTAPNSNNGMLEVTRQGRICTGSIRPRSIFQPQMPQQPCDYPRDRRHNSGNLRPQFTSSGRMFKRTRSLGAPLTTDRAGYNSSHHNYGLSRNPPPTTRWQESHDAVMPASNAYRNPHLPNVFQVANSTSTQTELPTQPILGNGFANSASTQTELPTQPMIGNGFANSTSAQTELPTQPMLGNGFANFMPYRAQMPSHQHTSLEYANNVPHTPSQQQAAAGILANSVPFRPLVSSQQHMGGNFGSALPSQPQVVSEPIVGGNFEIPSPLPFQNGDQTYNHPEPSQTQVSNQFEAGSALRIPAPSRSMSFPQPHFGHNFEYSQSPYQSQEYSLLPNSMQLGNQTLDASGTNPTVSEVGWITNTSPSNQQHTVDNSHIQSVEPANDPAAKVELYYEPPANTDFGPSELQFDNWFYDNENISDALEISAPPGLSVPSPEPASADGGLFFSF